MWIKERDGISLLEQHALNTKIAQQRQALADQQYTKIVQAKADNREYTRLFRPITDAVMGFTGDRKNFKLLDNKFSGITEAVFSPKGVTQFVNTIFDGRVTNARDIAEQMEYAALHTPATQSSIRDLLINGGKLLLREFGDREITKADLARVLVQAGSEVKKKDEELKKHEKEEDEGEETEEEDEEEMDDESRAARYIHDLIGLDKTKGKFNPLTLNPLTDSEGDPHLQFLGKDFYPSMVTIEEGVPVLEFDEGELFLTLGVTDFLTNTVDEVKKQWRSGQLRMNLDELDKIKHLIIERGYAHESEAPQLNAKGRPFSSLRDVRAKYDLIDNFIKDLEKKGATRRARSRPPPEREDEEEGRGIDAQGRPRMSPEDYDLQPIIPPVWTTVDKNNPFKMSPDGSLGKIQIDVPRLMNELHLSVRSKKNIKGKGLLMNEPTDISMIKLLTKRHKNSRHKTNLQGSDMAKEQFRKLIAASGLVLKVGQGTALQQQVVLNVSKPEEVVERLETQLGSLKAGNHSRILKHNIRGSLDYLLKHKLISDKEHKSLYDMTYTKDRRGTKIKKH